MSSSRVHDIDEAPGGEAPAAGFRAFVILWSGQFVSLTGSALSSFALGVYVYRLTDSVTTLGFVYALAFLPTILASPFTGSLVDRRGAKRALVVSNTGPMLVMSVLALLLVTDTFVAWHVYIVVTLNSLFRALQMPAFEASVPLLVPQRQLGRANGMRMLALAASQVLAPVAAGALLLAIDVEGIILMDCLSFGLALVTLLFVRIPRARHQAGPRTAGAWTLLSDFVQAWRYVVARRGLLALLLFVAALNFCAGFVDVLITPLVLAFASSDALGTVLSVGGVGMIATSLVMSAWGGPRRRVRSILGFSLMIAAATVIGSLRPNIALTALGAFLFLGGLAVIMGSNQSIWQTKVDPHLLGRAMALQNMVALTPQLLAYALAGVAADSLFEPLVGRDRVTSDAMAMLVGHGPGRGIALLLMSVGVLLAVFVLLAWFSPRLRHLEEELPDVASEAGDPQTEPAGAPR
ncbi:MFS transporter [Streptomyces chartreusis]|uniref:MFS transporter n=1 Tax=Streptomyces chartreusis TaxID=1969 RepID=UPI00365FE4ED